MKIKFMQAAATGDECRLGFAACRSKVPVCGPLKPICRRPKAA
tara:strand:- start:373 stop:501 length:129 start_codon:yes stop_codon:yes gene_type:complete